MNRTEARAMWKRVADGHTDDDVQDWIQEVARHVLEADDDPKKLGSTYRVYEITRAVGLSQKIDNNARLRELVEALEGFLPIETKGKETVERPFHHGEKMRGLIKWVRREGLVPDDASDPEVRKRIERILKPARKI